MSFTNLGDRSMKGIIVTFLYMLIGIALTPSITESVINTTGAGTNVSLGEYNLTGAARSIALLVPLFWVIIILGSGLYALTKLLE